MEEKSVINMRFNPSGLPDEGKQWWADWLPRAERKTAAAVKIFEDWLEDGATAELDCRFDDQIWKELKEWYGKNVFFRKCAYCERKVSGYPGDAEHYRPKNSVKQRQGGKWVYPKVKIPHPPTGKVLDVRHPGYFWLAYNWRNLIPACALCNSGNGKNDRFEINQQFSVLKAFPAAEIALMPASERPRLSRWEGYYYPTPAQLDLIEDPQLLYPMNCSENRDPRKHLRFGVRGIIVAKADSPYGQSCIDVFHLDLQELEEDRDEARRSFQSEYFDLCRGAEFPIKRGSVVDRFVDNFRSGKNPFSSAALDLFLEIHANGHDL